MKRESIFQKRLENGLNIVYFKLDNSPVVSTHLLYKTGSKNEKPHQTGFAHLFEHLMFEGTTNLPKGEFDRLCSQAGGTNNAFTIYDWTSYIMTLPKNQIELAFFLESDRMFNMHPTKEAFENQQKVVCEEIKQTVHNQPYGKWRELLAQTAFPENNGYSWEVHGKSEDVESATLEQALEFFDAFYLPSNAVLAIAGDFDPTYLFDLAEKYFNKLKQAITFPENDFSNLLSGTGTYEDTVPYSAVFLSYHTPSFLDSQSYVTDIISAIAGYGKSSLLYNNLLYKMKCVSETAAYADQRERSSLITFYAISNNPNTNVDELNDNLNNIILKLTDTNTIEEHIERTKNQMKMYYANHLIGSAHIAESVALNASFFNNPSRVFETIDFYNKITVKDCIEFVEQYLKDENKIRINVLNSK